MDFFIVATTVWPSNTSLHWVNISTTVFAYAKREFRNEWGVEAILPSFLQSIRCKQKVVDRWLADLQVTLLSV